MRATSFFLIIVALATFGCSSADIAEQEKAGAPLEMQFTSEIPDEALLQAFADRAMQKVHDYVELLELVSDSNIAVNFRAEASQQIVALFTSSKVEIMEVNAGTGKHKKFRLIDFVTKLDIEQLGIQLDIVNTAFDSPFAKIGESEYQAILSYVQTTISRPGGPANTAKKQVVVHLKAESKAFGEEEVPVWTVRLGEITALD